MAESHRALYALGLRLEAPHGPDHDGCDLCQRILRAMQDDTTALFRQLAEERR